MKLKRRGKSNRIRPEDLGIIELSKINEGEELRIMDRSKERNGEKISDESGLYTPKDTENYNIRKISPDSLTDSDLPRREDILGVHREDYNYGKVFAVGEQYLPKDGLPSHEETEYVSEDNYYDSEDYSIDSFFPENEKKSVATVRTYNSDTLDDYDNFDNNQELSDDYDNRDDSIEIPEDSDDEVIEDTSEDFINKSNEDILAVDNKNNQDILEINNRNNEDFHSAGVGNIDFDEKIKRIDQAEELRKKALASEIKEAASEEGVRKKRSFKLAQQEIEPEKEKLLKEVIEKMEGAASPKEKLAAQREVIRLGMVDVLVDSDDSEMVRPELLDEIGFTPGGDKEPEIVKNKRFRFGKSKKNKQKKQEQTKKTNAEKNDVSKDKKSEINKDTDNNNKEETGRKSIAQKQINDNDTEQAKKAGRKKSAESREHRIDMMKDPKKREAFIRKNRARLEKAGNDLILMQEKYENLTQCLNDIVLFDELPEDIGRNVRNIAGMVIKYRSEKEKTRKNCNMDDKIYQLMSDNKDEIPGIIRRLTENERYTGKLKEEIENLEKEKDECQNEKVLTEDRRKKTKNISILVIFVTVITMSVLIVLQIAFELDMQIPILLFGVCAILETLGIFVQHFKSESNETANHYKLNKLIKKQNASKVKYVNALNAVEFVYNKYLIHSSSELLFQWENYQKTAQARDDFRISSNELIYYEDRLKNILTEYGFNTPEVWVSQAEYLVESGELQQIKEKMTAKRSKLMGRMDKCKKVMNKLDNEISILVIKFPQYAEDIQKILDET